MPGDASAPIKIHHFQSSMFNNYLMYAIGRNSEMKQNTVLSCIEISNLVTIVSITCELKLAAL